MIRGAIAAGRLVVVGKQAGGQVGRQADRQAACGCCVIEGPGHPCVFTRELSGHFLGILGKRPKHNNIWNLHSGRKIRPGEGTKGNAPPLCFETRRNF
jgi:hypothetical protein